MSDYLCDGTGPCAYEAHAALLSRQLGGERAVNQALEEAWEQADAFVATQTERINQLQVEMAEHHRELRRTRREMEVFANINAEIHASNQRKRAEIKEAKDNHYNIVVEMVAMHVFDKRVNEHLIEELARDKQRIIELTDEKEQLELEVSTKRRRIARVFGRPGRLAATIFCFGEQH